MSELEFLGALQVELLRHREVGHAHRAHELFQTSTVEALLGGAFDGDLTLAELLEHGDHGLGTLDGLDGELIVIDGRAWKATLSCELVEPPLTALTPYAVVVPFSSGDEVRLEGPLHEPQLEQFLIERLGELTRPVAIRIDGQFEQLHVRSVPRQEPPYPPLAEAISHQHVRELADLTGTVVGFCFPSALDGIELLGWHLHFASQDRAVGGHVLSCRLHRGVAYIDTANDLCVELPPAVDAHHGGTVDQEALRRMESD